MAERRRVRCPIKRTPTARRDGARRARARARSLPSLPPHRSDPRFARHVRVVRAHAQSAQHAAANLNVVGEPGAVRALAGAALEAAKDRVHALHARVTGRHSFEDAVRAADEPAEPSRTTESAERPRAPPERPDPLGTISDLKRLDSSRCPRAPSIAMISPPRAKNTYKCGIRTSSVFAPSPVLTPPPST